MTLYKINPLRIQKIPLTILKWCRGTTIGIFIYFDN